MGSIDKHAELGIGTLITFIALILVVALAAGVLLTSNMTLRNKAMRTGSETVTEVGTSLSTVEIYGEDGSGHNISYIYHTLKLSSGSSPINIKEALVTFALKNVTQEYFYNYADAIDCDVTADMVTYSQKFGLKYSLQGTYYSPGYLNKGDIIRICFKTPRDVNEGEKIVLSIIPRLGIVHRVEAFTPTWIVTKRVRVYP